MQDALEEYMLAIEEHKLELAGAVVVDGIAIYIARNLVLEAPKAAVYLTDVPDEHRVAALEDLLDHGAAALSMARASAQVVLLERSLGRVPSEAELVEISDRWRPYRSLAVSYLFASEYEE